MRFGHFYFEENYVLCKKRKERHSILFFIFGKNYIFYDKICIEKVVCFIKILFAQGQTASGVRNSAPNVECVLL